MSFALQLIAQGVVVGSVYALVAMGFVLIYKASDVINFAQGEFLLLGAWIALTLVATYQVPFLPALLLTLVVSFLAGLAVERFVLRPFIGEPVISTIMATIGLQSAMEGLIQVIWGSEPRRFPPVFPQEPVHLGPIVIEPVYVVSVAIAAALLVLFALFFRYSRLGIAMRAAADDQPAAMSMGIAVPTILAASWSIAAIVSAVGGVLIGNIQAVHYPLAQIGLKVLPVAIFGGLDSIPGAIIGGIVVGVLENLAGGYLDPIVGGGMKEVAPFVVLLLVLVVRPYGLFGKPIIERV